MGIGHITLADRGWQLQQHFQRWFVRVERQQSPVEREHEHWLLFRLPFEPEGECLRTFSQCKEKERDPFPFWQLARETKVAINAVSTGHPDAPPQRMHGVEGCNG